MFNLIVSPIGLKELYTRFCILKERQICFFCLYFCHENTDLEFFSSLFAQKDDTRRYRPSASVTWLQRLKEGQERRRSRGAKCLQLEIRRGPILPVNHISKPLSVVIAFWTEQCFCQHGDTRNKKRNA